MCDTAVVSHNACVDPSTHGLETGLRHTHQNKAEARAAKQVQSRGGGCCAVAIWAPVLHLYASAQLKVLGLVCLAVQSSP